MGRKNSFSVFIFLLVWALSACNHSSLMEQNQQIKGNNWDYADAKTFTADITDTNITYNIYINIRHSFQFDWRNVWVNIETVFPNGKHFTKRINLLLAEPDGHWHADCLGDNCDLQVPIQENAYFPQPGKYTFILTQDMRVNPLPKVKSIGMRISKYEPPTKK